VDEEDEDQIARSSSRSREEQQPRPEEERRRRRRVKLGRLRTPEPMGLGMTHIPMEDDEEPRHRSSPRSYSVIDHLFEQLTALSTQLESAVELCRAPSPHLSRRLPHLRVSSKPNLNHPQSKLHRSLNPLHPDSLTQVLNEWDP
jgi:hypothetical protein